MPRKREKKENEYVTVDVEVREMRVAEVRESRDLCSCINQRFPE
jgi:hypothetical protein